MFGLYGACSTMGEGLGLGAMCVEGGFADHVLVGASSHFASAEKQFRFSVGIWESEAVFGYMDGDWVRSGDRVLRGLPGEGSARLRRSRR